ncbi:unnamed protein product [Nyctereutes procyonoides]|uniref:(raccoon dog) hypothetical protein n=1 Tax=Nyctereutes procyonoides TaxID=34880 RepID=A0A811ZEK9_NYCPR|nr:unnamed protein product [Nyctereutes procyonoides]
MTLKKFWHRGTESELISRTSHCQRQMPLGYTDAAVSYLLVFIDTFSGWTEAFPTKHEMAQTVTKKLLEDILPRYGFPVKIGSDNGPGFVSKVMLEIICTGSVKAPGTAPVFTSRK